MIIDRLSPDGLTPLWNKIQLESASDKCSLPDWVHKSYEAFIETIHQDNFPCFFGTLAEQKRMIRYAIAPSLTTSESFDHILEAVYSYLEEERNLTANEINENSLLLSLAIFFPLEAEEYSLEQYAKQIYDFLNELHRRDRFPWPEEIPTDPNDSEWRYCLGGRSLFVNISTPANRKRRSRNLAPGLIAVINPDDVFERVWKRWGEDPRHNIYKRMEKYDRIPPSPLLLHQESEWERDLMSAKLTVLSDRNDGECIFPFHYHPANSNPGECPFH
ncbi:YqcI/YcgG family protein [Spirulina sp. 06S082]|uniref:YqcI/YcgG family protein n=1 Tax=Spirulina sp. 06S082 TaxID=3110248 RepID=UPI002B2012EA|nr:YqcI/YcgG family protein [Spirulina sp. 06S082]MEA5470452.1 YqcI/YcgG family protein [Spirulina sp. 06S082]